MRRVLFFLFISCLLTTPAGAGENQQEHSGPDFSKIQILDLETAQRLALAGNPGMGAAEARLEQARARVKAAVAAWWPSLDLTASAGRVRYSDESFAALAGSATDQSYDSSSATLQATWVLFNGFYRSFKQEQVEFGEKSSAAARTDSQRLLVTAVAEGFFNAQLAQTKVRIAEADREFYEQQLVDANNRFEVGTGSWGDVLNIKVQLNSAKTSSMLGRREYEAAEYGLAALLGVPDSVFPETVHLAELDKDFKPSGEGEQDVNGLIEEALVSRPDLRKLTMQLQEAEAATGQAESPFWPKVYLAGAVSGSDQDELILASDDFGNSITLNMSWNLFSGGADKARLFEAKQRRREVSYSLADLRNQVASEIRQDIALLAAAREQVRLQRESVGLVEENRELARSEYEAGSASLVRLNEAQRDLTTTYGRLAQALVGYHLARQRLLSATGRNLVPFSDSIGEADDDEATD